jgi:hypothetical protein
MLLMRAGYWTAAEARVVPYLKIVHALTNVLTMILMI